MLISYLLVYFEVVIDLQWSTSDLRKYGHASFVVGRKSKLLCTLFKFCICFTSVYSLKILNQQSILVLLPRMCAYLP